MAMRRYRFYGQDGTEYVREALWMEKLLLHPTSHRLPYLDEGQFSTHSSGKEIEALYKEAKKQLAKFHNGDKQNNATLLTAVRALMAHPDINGFCFQTSEAEIVYPDYPEPDAYPHFTELAKWRYFSVERYKYWLEILREGAQLDSSNIAVPDIGIIDGEQLGASDFYMMAIAKDDPRNVFMGKLMPGTNCCAHYDGNGKKNVMASVTSPDTRVFVLFKKQTGKPEPEKDEIYGRILAFRGPVQESGDVQKDGVCLNSWEGRPESQECGKAFTKELAKRILIEDKSIERVNLGVAYRKFASPWHLKKTDMMIAYDHIGDFLKTDASEQATVLTQRGLKIQKGKETHRKRAL